MLQWASDPARGEARYVFVHKGFENLSTGIEGTEPSSEGGYPVSGVNWLDCVVWCNAHSEMHGLTPCYYQDGKFTKVLRSATNEIDGTKTGTRRRMIDVGNVYQDVTSNGYRLPTVGEWFYAASCGGERPSNGTKRVLHGGSYMTGEDELHIGNRFFDDPDSNQLVYGFRVARRLP